jgi:hypothetical protein
MDIDLVLLTIFLLQPVVDYGWISIGSFDNLSITGVPNVGF